jgi:hypothetical protein
VSDINLQKLGDKFREEDIEWRVQSSGTSHDVKSVWCLVVAYITNRAIMTRLDNVCGPANWRNEFVSSPCGKGYMCGISIKIDGEWVTRWDGAELSKGGFDPVKSTMSNSMKRAGVQWNIGRYLYDLESNFTDANFCDSRKNTMPGFNYQFMPAKGKSPAYGMQWKTPQLPKWAKPILETDIQGFIDGIEIAEDSAELRKAWRYAYNLATSENDPELLAKFTQAKDQAKLKFAEQEKVELAKLSVEAQEYVTEQLEIISLCNNEAVLVGQVKMVIEKAMREITDPVLQREALSSINAAKKSRLEHFAQAQQLNNQGAQR